VPVAALAIGAGAWWWSEREPDGSAGVETLSADARANLELLSTRLGLRFEIMGTQSTRGNVRFDAARPEQVERYVRWLVDEWADYPRCWIDTARLERVAFCSALHWEEQPRAGIPDFDGGAMYFDVGFGPDQEDYVRRVMHHEFFHSFDRFDDGELYADEAWSRLNPPGFSYGGGGVTRQSASTTSLLETGTLGFVDDYATSGLEEDKAELFAVLMFSPEALRPRIPGDPYLASKWKRLAELVASPCGGTDDPLPRE
jgi:hypothetical protein